MEMGRFMIYGWNMLYENLKLYADISIEEQYIECGFVNMEIWKDSLRIELDLNISGKEKEIFFDNIQREYNVFLNNKIRNCIKTVGDLKRSILLLSEIIN